MDQNVEISLRGLPPGRTVTLSATLTDDADRVWTSSADYRADRRGRVDVKSAPSLTGTYSGVDPAGLFWSMVPVDAQGQPLPAREFVAKAATDPRHSLVPVLARQKPYAVTISAAAGEAAIAQSTVTRGWLDPAVTQTEIAEGEVRGVLYQPTRSTGIGVVVLTGSGGGIDQDWAPLLAARGYSVLALGYFRYKDRPRIPAELPLEYFEQSLRWFGQRLGHDRIALLGVSRGTEAAMLTAANFPGLVKAVVAVAPGHLSTPGFHPQKGLNVSTWSLAGKPVPFSPFPPIDLAALAARHGSPDTPLQQAEWYGAMYSRAGEAERFGIPVERMNAPLLLLSGEDDQVWPSAVSGDAIAARLAAYRYAQEVQHLKYPDAGHTIWMSPSSVTTYAHLDYHDLVRAFTTAGGTPQGNAHASKQAFEATDAFLRRHLRASK